MIGQAIGGVREVSSIRQCFRGSVWQYGCIVLSTMICGMVAAEWMNQQEGRDLQQTARVKGPPAGTCCGISGRRFGGKNGGSRVPGLAGSIAARLLCTGSQIMVAVVLA